MTVRAAADVSGASAGAFGAADGKAGFNLGLGSGEDPAIVAANREVLAQTLALRPFWLQQMHGTDVVEADCHRGAVPQADASVTRTPGLALAILVADCMPVLLAARDGSVVGAAHAGWRGLTQGVIENTVAAMAIAPEQIVAWLGPAIGPTHFEVGADVLEAATSADPGAAAAFVAHTTGKWMADLHLLARRRLQALGVSAYGEGQCTFSDAARFYSYRRDRATGRMAALIWIEPDP